VAEYILSQATVYVTLFLFYAFTFINGDGSYVGKLYMFFSLNTSISEPERRCWYQLAIYNVNSMTIILVCWAFFINSGIINTPYVSVGITEFFTLFLVEYSMTCQIDRQIWTMIGMLVIK
jgi:hypothetical protein